MEVMTLLVAAGADPLLTDESGDTLLIQMASWGRTDSVKKLLQIEAVRQNINAQGQEKRTAFFWAAWLGHIDVMDLLLEAGADPLLTDENKTTPLMQASSSGKTAAASKLLEIEAIRQNIDAQDRWGRTAFLEAKEKGHQEIMDLLLEAGASPEIPQKSGKKNRKKKITSCKRRK